MAEQSMVERVKAAIARFNLDEMSPGYDADLEKAARAAIEAMRSPTEEMMRVGANEIHEDASGLDEAWDAMITAALKE